MQRFLQEHGEVQLSALGLGTSLLLCSVLCLICPAHQLRMAGTIPTALWLAAISSMVTVAEILKSGQWAVERSELLLTPGSCQAHYARATQTVPVKLLLVQ